MSQPLKSAAEAADAFVAQMRSKAPCRVEVKVESRNGMPLLCAVETVLRQTLLRPGTTHELVWLTGAPTSGGDVLRLQAFGQGNELLGKMECVIEA